MAETSSNLPQPLISLVSYERRKLLLESLIADYPQHFREVFRPVTATESRYITQFTSGRWREGIHHQIQSSEYDGDTEEDSVETSREEEEDPSKLVICGYDLQSREHRQEAEMIMQWDLLDRERHFPNLEKVYVKRKKAKSQAGGKGVGVSSVPKACQESPGGISIVAPSGSKSVTRKTSANLPEDSKKESVPEGSKQARSSSESDDSKLFKRPLVPDDCKLVQSSSVPDDSKTSSESDDSKLAKRSSESEMDSSGPTLRGKRKADSVSSTEGDDPDEKRTRKTSGDK